MNQAKMEIILQDAWLRLTHIQEEIREHRTNPVFNNYTPMRVTLPVKARARCTGDAETKALFRQTRRHVNTIRMAGSEFLKANGFTSGGLVKKVNPHEPKTDSGQNEIERLKAQIAALEARLK